MSDMDDDVSASGSEAEEAAAELSGEEEVDSGEEEEAEEGGEGRRPREAGVTAEEDAALRDSGGGEAALLHLEVREYARAAMVFGVRRAAQRITATSSPTSRRRRSVLPGLRHRATRSHSFSYLYSPILLALC